LLSAPLRDELDRVLRYPKLASAFPEPDRIVALLAAIAEPVEPAERLSVLADEPDNRVLEAAVSGQADLIVSGDARLLELGTFRGIRIITAREAQRLIEQDA
jgi:putative PIN family toxin of toxin-antitoxin system